MRNVSIMATTLVVVAAMAGCATRGSVREVQNDVRQQAQQIDRAAKRVDGFEQRADRLTARVDDLDTRVGRFGSHFHAANVVETIEVPFGFDRAELDDRAMTRLQGLAKELQADGRLNVELLGFTDPRGPLAYNLQLAHRRVEAVRRYLVQRGAPVSRVAAIGLGPVQDRTVPDGKKRRVLVRITMSEAMVATETPAAPPAPADASTTR
jgi:outer membrane protein OmpA-like peptidoglycan-associated protein